ncbi:CIS tube protein [Spirosoma flavum]|uniref:Contractile injection system tube protein N-terminal domain-containing protein n=1 Tax=Spirosoma flavum TaxID=2048557 RepID=A0ABW6ALE6_9BACT
MEKLKIIAYSDEKFSKYAGKYTVQVNPANFSHNRQVNYASPDIVGGAGKSQKFVDMGEEKLSFELTIDGTGIVDKKRTNVSQEIADLQKILYTYQGVSHHPNYIQLTWGSFLFKGVLNDMSVKYTLFRSDGFPLRVTVALNFTGFADPLTLARKADRQSSDLTHLYVVKIGDNLPLICYHYYGKPDYYIQVARFNGLATFRRLTPGTTLALPSLK